MSDLNHSPAQEIVHQAYQALRANDRGLARQLAAQAARLDPDLEDPWLILAGLAGPQAAAGYLKRVLQINPNSTRAQKGLEWVNQKLQATPEAVPPPSLPREENPAPILPEMPPVNLIKQDVPALHVAAVPVAAAAATPARRRLAWGWLIAVVALLGLAGMVWLGWPMISAVFAQSPSAPRPVGVLQKPSLTPTETATATATVTFTPTATFTATSTATSLPTSTYTATRTPLPTATPEPTDTRVPTRVPPTKTPVKKATSAPAIPPPGGNIPPNIKADQRWVDVDLTHQRAYAYQGSQVMRSFVVSTGIAIYPTVTGQYHIYVKYLAADMRGVGWFLPKVPYTMYFYKGYGLHGTYWHHNFGHPMSHGCVNMKTEDAAWLFDFASVGTLVNIHY